MIGIGRPSTSILSTSNSHSNRFGSIFQSNANMSATADPIAPISDKAQEAVNEINRTLCFTDVPCGALKVQDDGVTSAETADGDYFMKICSVMEKTFCFTDLEDVNESSLRVVASQEQQPIKEVDTESCSSEEDNVKVPEAPTSEDASPAAEKKPAEEQPVPMEEDAAPTKEVEHPKPEPPAPHKKGIVEKAPENALLASRNAPGQKKAKPQNALQATRAAKKAKQEAKKAEKEAKKVAKKQAKLEAKKNRTSWFGSKKEKKPEV